MIYVDHQRRLHADREEELRAFLRRLRISAKHITDGRVALSPAKYQVALDLGAVQR